MSDVTDVLGALMVPGDLLDGVLREIERGRSDTEKREVMRLLGEIQFAGKMQVIAAALQGCVMRESSGVTRRVLREELAIGDVERLRKVELADALEERIRQGLSLADAVQSLVSDGWLDVLDGFRRASRSSGAGRRSGVGG